MNTSLYAASTPVAQIDVPDHVAANLAMETAGTSDGHADRNVELTKSNFTGRPVGQFGCKPRYGQSGCCPGCYLAIENVVALPWDDHVASLFDQEIEPQRETGDVFRPPK